MTPKILIIISMLALCGAFSGCQSPKISPDDTVRAIKEVDTQPTVIGTRTHPVYPAQLKAAGIEGKAVIEFVVDKNNGRIRDVRIVEATHNEFGPAAADAVKQWKMRPAVLGGKYVNCRIRVPVHFTLSNKTG